MQRKGRNRASSSVGRESQLEDKMGIEVLAECPGGWMVVCSLPGGAGTGCGAEGSSGQTPEAPPPSRLSRERLGLSGNGVHLKPCSVPLGGCSQARGPPRAWFHPC